MEVIVDEMVIKSDSKEEMRADINETLERLRVINLKLDPKKWSFGVEEGRFSVHLITKQGIKADASNVKEISYFQPPKSISEIQSLELHDWKDDPITTEADEAFQRMKEILEALPTMTAPVNGKTLIVYLAAFEEGMSEVYLASSCVFSQPNITWGRARIPRIGKTHNGPCICHKKAAKIFPSSPHPGPLPIVPGGARFLVVAIDYFLKWVEAKPLISTTWKHMERFVWEYIVCRFRVPQIVISGNEKQFTEGAFLIIYQKLRMLQAFTSVYHPQANGQVEVTNIEVVKGMERRKLIPKRFFIPPIIFGEKLRIGGRNNKVLNKEEAPFPTFDTVQETMVIPLMMLEYYGERMEENGKKEKGLLIRKLIPKRFFIPPIIFGEKLRIGGRNNKFLNKEEAPFPTFDTGNDSGKKNRRHENDDDVRKMMTASGCGRLKEDLESSTWRRVRTSK
uniref:Reverse transcriptase domain-containing protein n=1 Tax=Tanacetum cinerariifolium TaxID=118510 RepID=A0A6L2LKE0_TANCI|nr:reverse transcriptase domain-containing protein [Tanacetum cinerariifolium]